MDYRSIVEYFVKRLVDEPESVKVTSNMERRVLIIDVRVAPNDIGKIIGKNGRIINCLRHFVSALSRKGRQKALVRVAS